MPNWCDTQMTIEGPKDQVENIRKLILKWTSKNYTKNDFGHGWLGNVVLGAGFSYGGENGLSCRGSITEIGEVEEKNQDCIISSCGTSLLGKMYQKHGKSS